MVAFATDDRYPLSPLRSMFPCLSQAKLRISGRVPCSGFRWPRHVSPRTSHGQLSKLACFSSTAGLLIPRGLCVANLPSAGLLLLDTERQYLAVR
jgi:hypothetical protein